MPTTGSAANGGVGTMQTAATRIYLETRYVRRSEALIAYEKPSEQHFVTDRPDDRYSFRGRKSFSARSRVRLEPSVVLSLAVHNH